MLTADIKTIDDRAVSLADKLNSMNAGLEVKVISEYSQPGSGSLAGYNIPTKVVAIKSDAFPAQQLGEQLRNYKIPIFTRIKDNCVLFDMRTVMEGDEPEIISALKEIRGGK
jgi:L-seryl-tRNA(Ser) seleniumtransferase